MKMTRNFHQTNERMCQNFLRLNADETEGSAFGPRDERSMVGAQLDSW